jgi:hypothetical protein
VNGGPLGFPALAQIGEAEREDFARAGFIARAAFRADDGRRTAWIDT